MEASLSENKSGLKDCGGTLWHGGGGRESVRSKNVTPSFAAGRGAHAPSAGPDAPRRGWGKKICGNVSRACGADAGSRGKLVDAAFSGGSRTEQSQRHLHIARKRLHELQHRRYITLAWESGGASWFGRGTDDVGAKWIVPRLGVSPC